MGELKEAARKLRAADHAAAAAEEEVTELQRLLQAAYNKSDAASKDRSAAYAALRDAAVRPR